GAVHGRQEPIQRDRPGRHERPRIQGAQADLLVRETQQFFPAINLNQFRLATRGLKGVEHHRDHRQFHAVLVVFLQQQRVIDEHPSADLASSFGRGLNLNMENHPSKGRAEQIDPIHPARRKQRFNRKLSQDGRVEGREQERDDDRKLVLDQPLEEIIIDLFLGIICHKGTSLATFVFFHSSISYAYVQVFSLQFRFSPLLLFYQ